MRFILASISSLLAVSSAGAAVDYTREVQPILQKHCYDCHGAEKQKGGLRLDVKAHALKGGEEHGPLLVAGKAAESILIKFTSGADEDMLMPPKGERLSSSELDTLRAWINEGASWPDDGVLLNDPLKTHWAYQPIRRPAVPENVAGSQGRNAVDAFLLSKLAEKGLGMSPQADARTLCRRLYFDVIGLPPSPQEVETFAKDFSKDATSAVEHLVAVLLQSPRYGERWARHWLDVVRFAESDGFEKNSARPNAWPYRDYVIHALNEDKPFDQFVREQLAGDVFAQDTATGFLVAGSVDTVRSPDPVLTAQQRADELNEIVSATGSAFLGLTLNCARCHNHKFDPISQSDYTAMCATFAGVQYGERALKPADFNERQARAQQLKVELQKLDKQLARFEPPAFPGQTLVIHPDDPQRTQKLMPSGPQRTKYEDGVARGEKSYPGSVRDLPTLGDGYWYWTKDRGNGDVFAWRPQVAGSFRVWVSWGSGYRSHDEDARYMLDADGDPKTTQDQREIGQADQRKFADGTGSMPNRKLWSGFKDLGVHEFSASSSLILRMGGDSGYPTADILVLQHDERPKPSSPRLRLPVKRDANIERFAPVEARFVRFTVEETTQLQPCVDEFEVFTCGDEPQNVALASLGTRASSSGNYQGTSIHQLQHVNDGLYGNEHSWISNELGKGWVQLELAQAHVIDRVVWSRDRDNVPRYNDRLATKYRVETSMDGRAWKAVATSQDRLPLITKLSVATIASAEGFPESEGEEFSSLQKKRESVNDRLTEAMTMPMAYAGKFTAPGEIHRYQRGDVTQPKEVVFAGVPASLGPRVIIPESATEQERRRALAEWIVSRENTLTARVIVNRLWYHHFGTGIVETPSDFGVNGGRPSHPELLDWLASELMDHNWSLKHIHSLILSSAAYAQSSAIPQNSTAPSVDTGCRLLWRFPPRRLEAEALRDTMLHVSGSLNLDMGGPGFDLFEPNTNYVKVYTTKEAYGPPEFRRMVYQSKPRVELDSIFGAFDCPDAGQATPKRTVSTTPLQALSLLNSSFAVQQADLFATRVRREVGNEAAAQCERAFLLAFGRQPEAGEAKAALALVKEYGLPALCRALYNANEFIQIR